MKLQSKSNLIYIEEIERTSNKGNQYSQIKLADPDIYENYTFFKSNELDVSNLKRGDKVTALLELVPNGFNNNINLLQLVKA